MTTTPRARFGYHFTCEVPDDYVPLPTGGSVEDWQAALEELLPASDEAQLAVSAGVLREAHDKLSTQNTVRTALCVGHRDESMVLGVLIVSVEHTGHDHDLAAAEGIYRGLKESYFAGTPGHEPELTEIDRASVKGVQGPEDTLLAARLPCGPAVSVTSLRAMLLPSAEDPAREARLGIATHQLIVPAPAEYCLYVTVFTPTLDHLDLFGAHLAHIGRTIEFDGALPEAAAEAG
ncbi:hypothetical protein [Streptomyces mayteni]